MRIAVAFVALMITAALASPAPAQRALASLPLRMDGHLMMVEVRINGGAPAWFAIASANSHTVLDPRLQRALRLPILNGASAAGAGPTPTSPRIGPVRMQLGGVQILLAQPRLADLTGAPIDPAIRGLLGAELFQSHVVRIDPVRRRLELFDPAHFTAPTDTTMLPLNVENDRLSIELTLDVRPGLSVTEPVRIDTGAEASVNHPIVAEALERRRSAQGNAPGDSFTAWSGRMQAVHIGPYVISDVWGPGGPGPAIGMELLRRFVLTFDAPHRRLYLTPTPALGEPVPAPPE